MAQPVATAAPEITARHGQHRPQRNQSSPAARRATPGPAPPCAYTLTTVPASTSSTAAPTPHHRNAAAPSNSSRRKRPIDWPATSRSSTPQWWSKSSTHASHSLQWCVDGGRQMRHVRQSLTVQGSPLQRAAAVRGARLPRAAVMGAAKLAPPAPTTCVSTWRGSERTGARTRSQ